MVRVGVLGQIGRFRSDPGSVLSRGVFVVCRTHRGVEYGEVLNAVHGDAASIPRVGNILRRATPEDHLLRARIDKNRAAAFDRCASMLKEQAASVVLMDVELLFDGKSIFFYFLGEVTPAVEMITSELAEAYEATVQLRQFAEAVTAGCGPDCGTKEGGCSDGGCSSCSVAAACRN